MRVYPSAGDAGICAGSHFCPGLQRAQLLNPYTTDKQRNYTLARSRHVRTTKINRLQHWSCGKEYAHLGRASRHLYPTPQSTIPTPAATDLFSALFPIFLPERPHSTIVLPFIPQDEWDIRLFCSLSKLEFAMSSTPVPPIEVGSLTASSPEESQFIGSSSGVFFVNTVHRAFAKSKEGKVPDRDIEGASSARDAASVENFLVGNESPRRSQSIDETGRPMNQTNQGFQAFGIYSHVLGVPPSQESATGLIMVYFQTWHPLFPFLHGPTFLRDVEAFYSGAPNLQNQIYRQNICRAIVFQCVFNIAALDRPDLGLPDASQIESSSSLLSLLGIVAAKHDIIGLQALLAMQLYLISTMSLRAASTVGGVLVKLLFHGGFHRCPFRYIQISRHDCEIRKRLFWSSYAIDRYLSQALGHPLGMQDSDIDVCIPGTEELHQPVPQSSSSIGDGREDARAHLPHGHPDSVQTPSDSGEQEGPTSRSARLKQSQSGEDVLANYVSYCRITGRALELFHKSLHTRSVDHRHITLLTSEVHSWWNNLPRHLQERTSNGGTTSFSAFFNIIYQSLIILINRPFLSLSPSTPEFRLSLQTCAGASRKTIMILRDHATAFSWPGILSGTWMAGLVLAFGCELDLYPFAKGVT